MINKIVGIASGINTNATSVNIALNVLKDFVDLLKKEDEQTFQKLVFPIIMSEKTVYDENTIIKLLETMVKVQEIKGDYYVEIIDFVLKKYKDSP